MGFFENIKQRHLTPCLHREYELLKGKDLASSSVVSPAPSVVPDIEFLDQGKCPITRIE